MARIATLRDGSIGCGRSLILMFCTKTDTYRCPCVCTCAFAKPPLILISSRAFPRNYIYPPAVLRTETLLFRYFWLCDSVLFVCASRASLPCTEYLVVPAACQPATFGGFPKNPSAATVPPLLLQHQIFPLSSFLFFLLGNCITPHQQPLHNGQHTSWRSPEGLACSRCSPPCRAFC